MIVETLLNTITQLLESLAEYIPQMTEAGVGIALGFITGVLNGVAENIGQVIQAAFNLIVSFINGLAQAVVINGPAIANAASSLVLSFAYALGYAAGTLIRTGGQLVQAVIQGFKDGRRGAGNTAYDVGIHAGKRMGDAKGKFRSSGGNLVEGAKEGVKAKEPSFLDIVGGIASRAAGLFAKVLSINSPSKVFMKLARSIPEGIILGVTKMEDKVYNTVGSLGRNMVNPMNEALSKITDISSTDIAARPVISPVLDLSDVNSKSGYIDSMLSRNRALQVEASMRNQSDSIEAFKQSLVSGVQDAVKNVMNMGSFNGKYVIEVPLSIDGKQFAKATASYNQTELNKRTIRLNRKNGIL